MAIGNCVTNLMKANDVNVKLCVFDDTVSDTTSQALFNEWRDHLELGLDNCIFKEDLHIVKIYNDHEGIEPIGVMNTKQVYSILHECFDCPESFRIDIITPNSTVFSWIFALASDLSNTK